MMELDIINWVNSSPEIHFYSKIVFVFLFTLFSFFFLERKSSQNGSGKDTSPFTMMMFVILLSLIGIFVAHKFDFILPLNTP